VSRRASLPGADELFRKTSERSRGRQAREEPEEKQVSKSANLQVAPTEGGSTAPRPPKHEEKVTFYCTSDDLMGLERARLALRSEHGIAADRGRIVRAALGYVLEDFEARSEDSILLRRLAD
jgi:hypothetical protein